MSETLTELEYRTLKTALQAIEGPKTDDTTMKAKLVGITPAKYQFDFDDEKYTCQVTLDDNQYDLVFTKSYYGQLLVLVISKAIPNKSSNKLYDLKNNFQKQGYGIINIDDKQLLPSLNTALQATNFKISNYYWKCSLDYQNKTLQLSFNKSTYFEINWQYGFYTNLHRQTGEKFFENMYNPLIDFPMSEMLEVHPNEYLRLTKLIKIINQTKDESAC